MQGDPDFDDDDLLLIDSLIEQDRQARSMSLPIIHSIDDQNSNKSPLLAPFAKTNSMRACDLPLYTKPPKQSNISSYFGLPNQRNSELQSKEKQIKADPQIKVDEKQIKTEPLKKIEENKLQNVPQNQSKTNGRQIQAPIKFPMKPQAQENTKKPLPTDFRDKNKELKESAKKTTPVCGSVRISEYIKDSLDKDNGPDFNKMSLDEVLKHFQDYETKIGKNSGYEPKVKMDPDNIRTWVYLLSKSFREYQFLMVETCLFHNTLVCLPTGLGKTFVAANVILNYYRWFPDGKIFFLAPTRPLVNQQKMAVECLKEIDEDDLLELTGSVRAKKRKEYYEQKRLFFMTPQTIENDLTNGILDPEKIVLIIFDEAHRALGKYAYSNIVKSIDQVNSGFRVVALSATPGNNEEKVQEVLDNLNIARLEAKDENDKDVKPYIQSRQVQEVLIKETTAITAINQILNEVLMKPIRVINKMEIFPKESKLVINKVSEINRTKLLLMLEEFNKKIDEYTMLIGPENKTLFYEIIGIITSLCHCKKILQEQGVESFIESMQNFKTNLKNKFGYPLEYKKQLIESPEFKKVCQCIEGMKGENHPKLKKLFEILVEFFRNKENVEKQSRVMIFTNNRSSANEICRFLEKDEKIKPSIFIGQNTVKKGGEKVNEGINQKKQFEILKKYKDYELNTLIATCIGEEGLDIGEIDLIICYDSGFSPIRLVQRMGRTGRKRAGKVIILLMEGMEYYKYKNSVKKSEKLKDGIKANSVTTNKKNAVLKAKADFRFYSFNPRMIPDEVTPKLEFIKEIKEDKASELKEKELLSKDQENSMFNLIEEQTDLNSKTIGDFMEENMSNIIEEQGANSKTMGDIIEDCEEDDFDYDEIDALLDAHIEKEKGNESNEFSTSDTGNKRLYEDSVNIDLSEQTKNKMDFTEDIEAENEKKTLKRKYEEISSKENQSGIKYVKLKWS